MSFPLALFERWFSDHESKIREDFFSFLRFRSISADPSYRQDCLKAAHWLRSYLEELQLQSESWESPGLPVVFGESKGQKGKPSLLFYHHYDVQPADPIHLWESDPFEPVFKEGKVVARGASDNKGQCFITLTALKAIQELIGPLPLDIKLFIEGEEESGGEGTGAVLHRQKQRLQSDFLCVVDFDLVSSEKPALVAGYRGIMTMQVDCTNAKGDLHSGSHGGIVLNPNRILVDLLAKLWDAEGKVAIPHFYDGVLPLTPEQKELVDFSFDEKVYQTEFGVKAFCKEEGSTLKEANWIRPTVELNGLWGGYTGEGFKTVIPSKASAKISCRLVPGQDPRQIFERLSTFLQQKAPEGICLAMHYFHGAQAYRASFPTTLSQTLAQSMEEIFKQPCLYTFCGGSVPIVRELAEATKGEVALFGFALDTDNIHAPNEHFEWVCFKKGFLTICHFLWELAQKKP